MDCCLFPLLGTANAGFGTLTQNHWSSAAWSQSQSPGGSAVHSQLATHLISTPLQAHESPCTTFPLYYNTLTLGIKREKLSKLLAMLEQVKRTQPNQGKAFTMGSHSEVIPSHGENYVGHQKVFHCCPVGAAAAHGVRAKGREGNSQNLHSSKCSHYSGTISAEQVKKGQQPESCKAGTQEMERERECHVRAGCSQPHLLRHLKANKKQTKSKQNANKTHPSPAPN